MARHRMSTMRRYPWDSSPSAVTLIPRKLTPYQGRKSDMSRVAEAIAAIRGNRHAAFQTI
jgi:hypothetical protein